VTRSSICRDMIIVGLSPGGTVAHESPDATRRKQITKARQIVVTKLIDHNQEDETRTLNSGTRRLGREAGRLSERKKKRAANYQQRRRKKATGEGKFHAEMVAETPQNPPVVLER